MEATEFMQQTKSNILHIIFLMKETIFIGTSFIKKLTHTNPQSSVLTTIFLVYNVASIHGLLKACLTDP